MKGFVFYGIMHLLLLIAFTLKETYTNLTFYNLLTTTTRNTAIHVLHASFLIYLMYCITRLIIFKTFGELRTDEATTFSENFFYFLTDFLLIIPTFDNDVNYRNTLIFSVLLCVKSLNWILAARITRFVEPSYLNLAWSVLGFSLLNACIFFISCYKYIDGHILFLFEYSLLSVTSIKNIYLMNGNQEDSEVQSKRNFLIDIFYLSSSLIIYACFIVLTSMTYKIPLNLFRSFLVVADQLVSKVKTFVAYMKLCKELEKCIDGTGDGYCPVCHDDMEVGKKLKCGHVFHLECLKKWCERQQNCPMCKAPFVFDLKKEEFVVGNQQISGIPVTFSD